MHVYINIMLISCTQGDLNHFLVHTRHHVSKRTFGPLPKEENYSKISNWHDLFIITILKDRLCTIGYVL